CGPGMAVPGIVVEPVVRPTPVWPDGAPCGVACGGCEPVCGWPRLGLIVPGCVEFVCASASVEVPSSMAPITPIVFSLVMALLPFAFDSPSERRDRPSNGECQRILPGAPRRPQL